MLIARFRNSEVGSDVMRYTDPLEIGTVAPKVVTNYTM